MNLSDLPTLFLRTAEGRNMKTQRREIAVKVVILGGGFAGRNAALALSGIAKSNDVVLIDRYPFSTMLPSLPDYAGGRLQKNLITGKLRHLLPRHIAFLHTEVNGIDLEKNRLTTTGGVIKYDRLIIACGSKTATYGFSPEGGTMFTLDSLPSAQRIRNAFPVYLATAQNIPITVVAGGGYTGLELACSLKRASSIHGVDCRVMVVEMMPRILPFLSSREREYVERGLRETGVEIRTGKKVTAYNGEYLRLSDDTAIRHPFFCWSTGTTFSIDSINAPASDRIKDGRFVVTPTLQVRGYPNVWAAGDAAAVDLGSGPLRKAVNFSIYEGRSAGKACAASISGSPPPVFRPVDLGWIIPLCTSSVGRVFSAVPIRGTLGLRLHYFFNGYRNYSFPNFLNFSRRALSPYTFETSREP